MLWTFVWGVRHCAWSLDDLEMIWNDLEVCVGDVALSDGCWLEGWAARVSVVCACWPMCVSLRRPEHSIERVP